EVARVRIAELDDVAVALLRAPDVAAVAFAFALAGAFAFAGALAFARGAFAFAFAGRWRTRSGEREERGECHENDDDAVHATSGTALVPRIACARHRLLRSSPIGMRARSTSSWMRTPSRRTPSRTVLPGSPSISG